MSLRAAGPSGSSGLFRLLCFLLLVSYSLLASAATTVRQRILVLARDAASAYSATSGLKGYGIPYQVVLVPQSGATLPILSTGTEGHYGGIIILSEVAYEYASGWSSALTAAQWQTLYDYQTAFGVRMVRLDCFPNPTDFAVTTAVSGSGCCNAGVEQLISFTDVSAFPTANLKINAGVSTQGLWHYPATITNATVAKQIAKFAPSGSFTTDTVAAVINNFAGRQQMAFFISWATDWSPTSVYLQHAYIHWMTRGLFVGKRKTYLSVQVDDMHVETDIYSPAGNIFRVRPGDLTAHKNWQAGFNSRLPAGSSFFLEIGHNGNGAIIAATDRPQSEGFCNPNTAVDYESPPDTPLEWMKPLGTGTNLWDPQFQNYNWSLSCVQLDPVASWFLTASNRETFAHLSHTFTHLELNNATYYDANKEIVFNKAWMQQMGISGASKFSVSALIPPAITGLHNGDAIKAWWDNGIRNVVGDRTRPVINNPDNEYWPLITTVAGNGYAGLTIIPRWATTIFYNCDTPSCCVAEWIATSGGAGTFTDLMANAKAVNTRHLLALHPDPFMFHQANMRQIDAATYTVGSQSGRMSLIQIWVETIGQEMTRLTNWPIRSLKQDDIAKVFLDRQTVDNCAPLLTYTLSADNKSIVSATLTTATANTCAAKVPVTFPVASAAASVSGATNDKVGSEPLIVWTPMNGGSGVTFTFSPVTV